MILLHCTESKGVNNLIYILIIALITAIDILIKNHIERYYWNDNSERYLLGRFIRIHKLHNYGGFLHSLQNHVRLLKVLSASLILIVAIVLVLSLPKKGNKIKKLGLSLILGGALSNEYDRYIKGSVTDYFSINIPLIKKIVFNIGDLAIFAGIILALFTGSSGQAAIQDDSKISNNP